MSPRPGRTTRLLARRRKRERLAGIALAGLGVLVLIVAIVALRDPNQRAVQPGTQIAGPSTSHSSATPKPTPPPATPSVTPPQSSTPPASTPQKLPLVVLNNTTTSGLAQSAAERFTAGGWTVTSFANYTNDILSTCAYYDPAVSGAQDSALALQAQYPTIKRVLPQFSSLAQYASPIVVVLTPGYSPS